MEFQDRQSIYLQIGDYVCENILKKLWLPGDRIPSIREMAASIQVNPNTVLRTYTTLQEKGIIENHRGLGYFVSTEARQNILSQKRDVFKAQELPKLFNSMDLLGIDMNELGAEYRKWLEVQKSKPSDQPSTQE